MNRFSIHMSDQVSSLKTSLVSRATILYIPDHMINSINVTVTGIDPDCSQSEAKLLPRAGNDDWLTTDDTTKGGVSAGGGISGGWV